MKPIHFAAGVAVTTLFFGGALVVASKIQYDADGRAIERLIADYKAMGVATNGTDFFHKIPDSQNAWVDIAPLLFNKHGFGNGPLYRVGIANDLLMAGTQADLPAMRRYLAVNQPIRDIIDKAFAAKPNLQVPHNYNEGYAMLLPEFATMKGLVKDYSLAAYVAALQGDTSAMRRNFDSAKRLTQHCETRDELIGHLLGAACMKIMANAGLRIVEAKPGMLHEVAQYFTSPDFFHPGNDLRILEGDFMAQVVTARAFDSTLMDKKTFSGPLARLFPAPSLSELEKAGKVRQDDYMPESHTVRRFLRRRLERWKPFMTDLVGGKITPFDRPDEFAACFDAMIDAPPQLMQVYGMTDADSILENFNIDVETNALIQTIFKSLEAKAKTGHYPANLHEIGVQIPGHVGDAGFDYYFDERGVVIQSKRHNESGFPSVQIAFPVNLEQSSPTRDYRKTIDDFAAWRTDDRGNPLTWKLSKPPSR